MSLGWSYYADALALGPFDGEVTALDFPLPVLSHKVILVADAGEVLRGMAVRFRGSVRRVLMIGEGVYFGIGFITLDVEEGGVHHGVNSVAVAVQAAEAAGDFVDAAELEGVGVSDAGVSGEDGAEQGRITVVDGAGVAHVEPVDGVAVEELLEGHARFRLDGVPRGGDWSMVQSRLRMRSLMLQRSSSLASVLT